MISRFIKSVIEENQLSSVEDLKKDQATWIRRWTETFLNLLLEGKLDDVFQQLLREKIAASEAISFLTDEKSFLYELFLIGNSEYHWADEKKLEEESLKSGIDWVVFIRTRDLEETNHLKDRYQSFLTLWINEQINSSKSSHQETFYINLFRVFF